MKYRKLCGYLTVFIILLIDRLTTFIPLYEMFNKEFINKTSLTENLVIGDYTASVNILVIPMILFVFLEDYINDGDAISRLTRYTSIEGWHDFRLKNAARVACAVASIYMLIEVITCLTAGDVRVMIKHNVMPAFFIQYIVMMGYLILVWYVKEIMEIYNSRTASKISVIVSFSLWYFVTSLYYPTCILLSGFEVVTGVCGENRNLYDCLGFMGGLILVLTIVKGIFIRLRNREDIWI